MHGFILKQWKDLEKNAMFQININKGNTNILFYTFIRFIKLRQLK